MDVFREEMRTIKEECGLELKFNEETLLLYLERTPQGRVFSQLYTPAHFQGIQVGFGYLYHLLYLLDQDLFEEIPEDVEKEKCGIVLSGNQIKYVETHCYNEAKQNLLQGSKNREVTELKIMEIELISLMLRSLDVLCMAYVSGMNLPEEIKRNLHSDKLKDRKALIEQRTDAFLMAKKWMKEHPDKNVPVNITETIRKRAGRLYGRFVEIDGFYSSPESRTLSMNTHKGYIHGYRKEVFDLFGRDFRGATNTIIKQNQGD